jgi:hypothetical protein
MSLLCLLALLRDRIDARIIAQIGKRNKQSHCPHHGVPRRDSIERNIFNVCQNKVDRGRGPISPSREADESYRASRLSLIQAFDDAIMLDHRGLNAEVTGANIFLVIDGQLHAPITDCFLNGKTRLAVIDIVVKNSVD